MRSRLIFALASATLLSACAVGPDYERPGFSLPESWPWQGEEAKEAELPHSAPNWWVYFNDPALTALVEEGLAANTDLAEAAARVSQARALLTLRESDLFPTVYAQGEAFRTRGSAESRPSGIFTPSTKPYNDFGLAAILDYELDLWGRLRRASESARAGLLSAEADRDAVRLAVASEISAGYFNLLALETQLLVTEQTVRAREEQQRYQEAQYRHGAVNGLVYSQAQAEFAAAQAQISALLQARQEQETALGILLGRDPKGIVESVTLGNRAADADTQKAQTLDRLPGVPASPDLPSTLLERRPDIRAAEQALISANADIGVARADYFPRVSLSGLLGLGSNETGRLLQASARRWQVGADFTSPILDFGTISSNVAIAEAGREAALARYRRTVALAFKETLDAMSAQSTAASRAQALQRQVDARAEALRLAGLRYEGGYSNYLEVLDAQRFLYQSQLERIVARRDALVASVSVFKAIGGGFGEPVTPQVAAPLVD